MLTSRILSAVAVAIGGAGLYSPPLCRQKPSTRSRTSPRASRRCRSTGERTLPDVPEENYWFQRHLAVYRWIAERVAGLDVVDMACGEGYGTAELARRAARVTGVDANPEAFEHARLKYTRPGRLVRARPRRVVVGRVRRGRLPPDDRARREPEGGARALPLDRARRLRLDAERADARARGRGEVRQPVAREGVPRRGVPRAVRVGASTASSSTGCSTRASCGCTRGRSRPGGTRCTRGSGITKRFYDWFTPAISDADFALREEPLDRALDFVAVLR